MTENIQKFKVDKEEVLKSEGFFGVHLMYMKEQGKVWEHNKLYLRKDLVNSIRLRHRNNFSVKDEWGQKLGDIDDCPSIKKIDDQSLKREVIKGAYSDMATRYSTPFYAIKGQLEKPDMVVIDPEGIDKDYSLIVAFDYISGEYFSLTSKSYGSTDLGNLIQYSRNDRYYYYKVDLSRNDESLQLNKSILDRYVQDKIYALTIK